MWPVASILLGGAFLDGAEQDVKEKIQEQDKKTVRPGGGGARL